MQEKLKQLELLISQVLARQKELATENAALKQRMRVLEENTIKLKEVETSLKELKEWKKNAQIVLRRVHARLEKEIEKAREEENKIV
jgi:hypothetical protein